MYHPDWTIPYVLNAHCWDATQQEVYLTKQAVEQYARPTRRSKGPSVVSVFVHELDFCSLQMDCAG